MEAVVDSPAEREVWQIPLRHKLLVDTPPLNTPSPVTVNDPPIPTFPEKIWFAVQVLALARFKEATTAPVVGEIVRVPSVLETEVIVLVTDELREIDPPNETDPPPDNPLPVLIVMEALDRAELGILLKVLEDPEIVLLVKVCVALSSNTVPVASGRVIILAEVGVQVRVPVEPKINWSFVPDNFRVLKVGAAAVDTS